MLSNLFGITTLFNIICLVPALTLHEFAHAFTANYFGDDTPRLNGRLTLNPLAHLDILGSLMFLMVGFGWAKPVMVNPYALNRRSRWAMMWTSLAGPLANLTLAILAAVLLRLGLLLSGPSSNFFISLLFSFLLYFMFVNLTLAIFNLIPISPLDGEKVLEPFLPPSAGRFLESIRPYGPIILMGALFILPRFGIDIFSLIITPITNLFLTILGIKGLF